MAGLTIADFDAMAPPDPETTHPDGYELRTTDQIELLAPSKYRIKGLLQDTGIACIFGASGSGKSFLAMDMAVSISDGLPWFGRRVKPCDVVWVCLEGLGGLERRVKAFRQQYGPTAGERMRFVTDPFRLGYTDDVDRLIQAIKREEVDRGLIVIDTLNAATPGMDENSSADMGNAIDATKRIQAECGGLVELIHHSGKDATRGLRGHSSLHGALDTLIEVTRDQDRRTWKLIKSKDGADGEEHQFRLNVVELGTDEDGDPITSCTIGADDSTDGTYYHKLPPKGGNLRIIWDALGPLFAASHSFGKATSPPSRPCIEFDMAVDRVRTLIPCETKRQTERARASIRSLVGAKHLDFADGWLWIP